MSEPAAVARHVVAIVVYMDVPRSRKLLEAVTPTDCRAKGVNLCVGVDGLDDMFNALSDFHVVFQCLKTAHWSPALNSRFEYFQDEFV
ncbi:MAG: hypothetical protein H5T34_04830 [Candidatus Methanomethyliales bacterium]|nr:hypothetical protein [Candidatus Methanomethylicales archaeon]